MKLSDFDPALPPEGLEDCEVAGVLEGRVLHYKADDGTVYDAGLTLEDWLDGHQESWLMTEAEAARAGIADYEAYAARVADRNPALVGTRRGP